MNFFGNVKVIRESSCALLLGVILGACSVEQDFEGGGIDGTGYSAGNDSGYASFYVTDAPIDDAKQVIVAFTAIEVISVDGAVTIFEFPEEKKIDLLQLQGTASETLLNNIELVVGEYQSIRLQVNAKQDDIYDSWIEMNDGTQFELNIPSGDQSGLKINHHFSISKDESLSFTIDFDLRKSQLELSWADSIEMLNRNYHELTDFIEGHSEQELYGAPMMGANNQWTPGRWAEAAGSSHFRSASKYIRAAIRKAK